MLRHGRMRGAANRSAAGMTPSRRPRNRSTRDYHRSGQHIVARALPYLLERVAGEKLSHDALTPLERAAREWRHKAEQDAELAATKRAPLDRRRAR